MFSQATLPGERQADRRRAAEPAEGRQASQDARHGRPRRQARQGRRAPRPARGQAPAVTRLATPTMPSCQHAEADGQSRASTKGRRVMKDPRDIILAPVVSEKSYGLIEQGVYTFKVHPSASKPEISRRRRGDLGRRRRARSTPSTGKGKVHACASQQPRPAPSPTPSGPSSPWQRARDPAVRELSDTMAIRSRKPTSPGRRFQTTLRLRRDHQDHAGEVAALVAVARAAAATSTAARRHVTAVAATSVRTA